MFFDACHKAFKLDPKTTLISIIRKIHLDITTLFTKEQIQQAQCSSEIGEAYKDCAKFFLYHKNDSEKALEHCKYALQYGSLQAVIILVEKLKLDLNEFVLDQKERTDLYFNAAELCYQEEDPYRNHANSIQLYLKAADEGSIPAMLKIIDLGGDFKKTRSEWICTVAKAYEKEKNFEKAVEHYQKAANFSGNLEAMEKLGNAYLSTKLSEDGLYLKSNDKKGTELLFMAAKRHEEINNNQKAFEIYSFLTKHFFTVVEPYERLARCFENGELGQEKNHDTAATYYRRIADINLQQISSMSNLGNNLYSDYVPKWKAVIKATLKAFTLDTKICSLQSLGALRMISCSGAYRDHFTEEMKAEVALKIQELRSNPELPEEVKENLNSIEKDLGRDIK